MDAAALCQLAQHFVAGLLPVSQIGVPIGSTATRTLIAPPAGLAHVELESAANEPFALHVWPSTPPVVDVATLRFGIPGELPRLGPHAPRLVTCALRDGLVVLEVAVDRAWRLVAMHAYRVPPDSLAGAFATEAHVLALFALVTGDNFTRDAIHRAVGRILPPHNSEYCGIVPRPSTGYANASVHVVDGALRALSVMLFTPRELDLTVIAKRLGLVAIDSAQQQLTKRTFRDARGATLEIITLDRTPIRDITIRRHDSGLQPARAVSSTRPPRSLAVDHVIAIADAFFEHGVDEAVTRRLLDCAGPATGGRARVSPGVPDIDGAVLQFAAEHATIELELAPSATFDPRVLEPRYGASWPVAPVIAYAPPRPADAQRFPVRGAAARGCIVVAPDRITLSRVRPTAWLGDFTRADDALALIARFLDEPSLSAVDVLGLIGHPEDRAGDPSDQLTFIAPFAGSNLFSASVHASNDRLVAITLRLNTPLDLRARAQVTAHPIEKGVEYRQEIHAAGFLGYVVITHDAPREEPLRGVTRLDLVRVWPKQPNPFR